jgi:hypothetical protein
MTSLAWPAALVPQPPGRCHRGLVGLCGICHMRAFQTLTAHQTEAAELATAAALARLDPAQVHTVLLNRKLGAADGLRLLRTLATLEQISTKEKGEPEHQVNGQMAAKLQADALDQATKSAKLFEVKPGGLWDWVADALSKLKAEPAPEFFDQNLLWFTQILAFVESALDLFAEQGQESEEDIKHKKLELELLKNRLVVAVKVRDASAAQHMAAQHMAAQHLAAHRDGQGGSLAETANAQASKRTLEARLAALPDSGVATRPQRNVGNKSAALKLTQQGPR